MKSIICALTLVVLGMTVPAVADAPIQGTIATAKTGENALVLWDCTPVVVAMVNDKQPRDEGMKSLQSQAMEIAGQRASSLSASKTITVRVVYQKIGAVNPAYGSPTFAGVEKVFDLTVAPSLAKSQSAALAKSLAAGTTPKGVTVQITGELPPM